MADTLAVDTATVRAAADLLDRLARRALELAATLDTALRSADLPPSTATLVTELGDELAALDRFLRATCTEATTADRLDALVDGERWFVAVRADRAAAEERLWAGLSDGIGATALDAGAFSLANSIVAIERAVWMRTAIPPGCRSFGPDAYYTGGGAVRGPDGRLYPIVVPHVDRGDRHYTIDADVPHGVPTAASLDGHDAGWVVVGYRTGVEQIHAEISGTWQALMAAAFATGLRAPGFVDVDHLAAIRIRLGSRPTFVGSTSASASGGLRATTGQEVQPHTGPVVDGRVGGRTAGGRTRTTALPTPPAAPGTVAQANRHINAASLVIDGLQGVQVALSADDANQRAYEVILEEHPDGRLRSRVQTFHLEPRADGVLLAGWHLFVDDDGVLRQSPVKYQTPRGSGDDSDATDGPVAVNELHHDVAPTVPNPAFDLDHD